VEGGRAQTGPAIVKRETAIVLGESVEISWNRAGDALEATVNGRVYDLEVKELRPGVYWFVWNGRSLEAVVTETTSIEGGHMVSIRGHRIPVELLDARKALRRASDTDHAGAVEVRAPMPGKIVRVLVTEGAEVAAHQGIVIMEAMKMQNEIRSPKKGRIQGLAVVEGAAVNSQDLIALVE
jgi:biotin carboxyl carrier protein